MQISRNFYDSSVEGGCAFILLETGMFAVYFRLFYFK